MIIQIISAAHLSISFKTIGVYW